MINQKQGFILASMIISMTLVFLISVVVFQLVGNNFRVARAETNQINAQLAADAGADIGINELNLDEDYSGSSGEIELFNNTDMKLTYELTVANGATSSEKVLTSTGRTYVPANASSAVSSRSYEVDLTGLGTSSGTFSIVTGVGGLVMSNSAKIVDGDVYVNGSIDMSNSAQIGTTTNSVSVKAAHYNCPSGGGASYPSACSSGQPITMSNSSHIYGDVCANNQTSDYGRMTNGGLDTSCADLPLDALDLPEHDRDQQKANIVSTETSSFYTKCDSNTSRTWGASGPIKIDGDVEISKKCKITLLADIWVTGKLDLKNSGQFIVSDSITLGGTNTVDANRPTIMVDGDSATLENSGQLIGNSSDVGIQLITYWSKAACSPNCADVTGNDLYDSRDTTTILLKNSAKALNSILYAKWSQVDLDNGGDIGALVGQTVKLQNSAAVTFGASVGGGGGGSSNPTWLISNYRRSF